MLGLDPQRKASDQKILGSRVRYEIHTAQGLWLLHYEERLAGNWQGDHS